MRELTASEVDEVAGGAVNLGTAGIGAGVGGFVSGSSYAMSVGMDGSSFSWGQFAGAIANGAASGFLIGSGSTLIYAGATGALKGATVAGVSLAGAGAALAVAGSASGTGDQREGGGSN